MRGEKAMKIQSVYDSLFRVYGRILSDYNFNELLSVLKNTPNSDRLIYIPSSSDLEKVPVFEELRDRQFGGMPIQIGYCNGYNKKLNCLEYHKNSEINIPLYDMVLLLGLQQDILNGKYATQKVAAFRVPAGTAVELFATTLHYAPCHIDSKTGYKVACVLPRDTNTEMPDIVRKNIEDQMLRARNKWLLAHPQSTEAAEGAYIGLEGENVDISGVAV